MKRKIIPVKEIDHKPALINFQKQSNYRERKAKAKCEEEVDVRMVSTLE